jgi:L-alanine-DL-glutamate epimerase-like enolase superfamily enzyme
MRPLDIPFKTAFSHASAERNRTGAVLVVARSAEGSIGVGEGCPRDYVTGETLASARAFFDRMQGPTLALNDLKGLTDFVEHHQHEIDVNPAAWCAIETAILDCMSREARCSIEQLLGLSECVGRFQYSAVLGVANADAFQKQLQQYLAVGFRDFKIKLSGRAEDDQTRLALLAERPDLRIRLDANNLWEDSGVAIRYLQTLPSSFWAIEEPLAIGDLAGCQHLAEALGVHVILDESFLREQQLDALVAHPEIWIPNLRVSKMSGVLRSLRVMQQGVDSGLQFIIGAQVGETSILTRLALTLANAQRAHVLAQEGAFGTHLLERDITSKPLMFGGGGILDVNYQGANGLGIDYDLL